MRRISILLVFILIVGTLPAQGIPEEASPQTPKEIRPFGYDIFNLTPQSFQPPDVGPVGPEYPMGPGDEILINIWGEVELSHSLTVDREGKIFAPNVGRVIVNGLTLSEVRKKLIKRMEAVYSSIREGNAWVDISLGKLKKIKVFIIGEVVKPGGYTISSVSDAFNALYYAGGPTPKGSLRKVDLIRNDGTVEKIDLYEYLLHGRRYDIRLHNGNTILVPPIGKKVTLRGEVHRPAIYELEEDEGLRELIEIAGGIEPEAYPKRIHITRIKEDSMKKVVDVNLKKILESDSINFSLRDGDEIEVFRILDMIRNYVDLKGNVWRPGRFERREGMTVKDLVQKGNGVKEDTYLERALIVRTLPNEKETIIRFNLREALQGNSRENHYLQKRDNVIIRSIWDLGIAKKEKVTIYGRIKNSGRYSLYEGMSLEDLIFIAGGLTEDAYKLQAEVARIIPEKGTDSTQIIPVKLKEEYGIEDDSTGHFPLKDHDMVFIRRNPHWQLQREVIVTGEVVFPGKYSLICKDERLSHFIHRAGGLKKIAYPEATKFVRRKSNLGRIDINLSKALKNPDGDEDIVLEEGDSIHIPRIESTVRVLGEVKFPISFKFEPSKNVSYYIEKAGGFTNEAHKGQVTLVLPSGRAKDPASFLWFDVSAVPPGSKILVPRAKETEGIDWSEVLKNISIIVSSTVTTIFVIDRLAN